MIKPTQEEKLQTFEKLSKLSSRRLIQFNDAVKKALKELDPKPDDKGRKAEPNIEKAILILKETKVLK